MLRAAVRPGVGRLRRARRSSRRRRRSSSCCAAASRDDGARRTLDGDGGRRHVRPRRRRLPPLLGRRALARAALREDAVRQRAARPRVPARVARHRRGALPRGRRGDARLHAARAAARRRRLRLVAGRRHRRRRGADVHVDGGRRACRPELLQPFEHGRSIIRGELDRARARDGCSRSARAAAAAGARRQGDRRPGTVSRSPRSPRRARRLDRDDCARGRTRLGEFLLGPLDRRRRLHRTWRDGRARASRLPRRLRERRARALRAARRDRRAALARASARRLALLAVELFADDERGGFFLTPADGEELVARQKDLDDNPTPSGNSMLAFVLLRLARIWGDDELERRAVGVLRLVRDVMPRAPSAFGWALCALDLYLSPPREIAIVGAAGSEVARAALARLRPERGRRLRARRGGAAARGQGSRRRQAGRLRLRALRVPGAGHGSGRACR